MTARDELAGILQQWLQLTQDEGAAIEAGNWSGLFQIQARKSALRGSFNDASRRCAEADAQDPSGKAFHRRFRLEVAKIISLLTRNNETLTQRLQQARSRRETLGQARRNLGRIQRSYLRPQLDTALHSYS